MRRIQHQLHRRDTLAVAAAHQSLGNDRAQVVREIHEHLRMLLLREEVDDAVQRFRRIVGVHGCQDQVAGAGHVERRPH